jgi:hypothetical protein
MIQIVILVVFFVIVTAQPMRAPGAGDIAMQAQPIRPMMAPGAGDIAMPAQPIRPMMAPGAGDIAMPAQPIRPMIAQGFGSNTIVPTTNVPAAIKQEELPAGSMRIDLSSKHMAFFAGALVRGLKHRTLVFHVLTGQWSEIDGKTAVLDVLEFEAHLWIAQQISNYLSNNLPIQGMGNAFIQIGYLALAETYLTRQRLKGMIAGIDETEVSFANEVAQNFGFLGEVVVAKLAAQVNLKERGQSTPFVINGEVEETTRVTVFIFRVEGHVVYKVALFRCTPKYVFIREKKSHVFLELTSNTCQRESDEVVYMMNLK